ncbi:MAG: hypothetical protein NC213_03850 [Acetobacter sp.]|nr:hypothetical protein [Bacteroides sp.]MCM1340856.1 hypothetical protein [Acetobacter sp.]MCM1432587.1 hypothetical protein [Clostridiales bacterium]
MKKIILTLLCALLVISCFSGCSKTSNELTEENVKATVDIVTTALQNFDTEDLDTYVESSTLQIIAGYAEKHQQFTDLGKALFENLTVETGTIDLENNTVTLYVKNKDLYDVASDFANGLKSSYSSFQLLSKLSDEEFLDTNLSQLCQNIDNAEMQTSSYEILLTIKQEKKNLVLSFNSNAENAVSGGALDAITAIYK